MKIIACNSNKVLAEAITSYIGVKLADAVIRNFADGDIFVKINENIRGEDIFIIQSTSPPVNDRRFKASVCKKNYCCYSLFWLSTTG